MGDVTISYYTTRQRDGKSRWGYWAPCLKRRNRKTGKIEPTLMAKLGFKLVHCGEDGPRAWAIAESWNKKWRASRAAHLAGETVSIGEIERVYPPDSIGEAFVRYKGTNAWKNDKKPRTREDWERGWKHIEPIFGDVDPRTISLEDMDSWYGGDPNNETVKGLLQIVGVREAHRAMKIWRALWKVIATIKKSDGSTYCDRNADPSLGIRRKTPKPRKAYWVEGQAVRLVKRAWRMKFYGLAALLATAWDSSLSPVDVRMLTSANRRKDAGGQYFDVGRAKTGKAAIGTLSRRTVRLLDAYLAGLPVTLHPDTPIFLTRGGAPTVKGGRPRPPVSYSKDQLGKDFRTIRAVEFPGDTRTIADFRRSGAIEVIAGDAPEGVLSSKMANTIEDNRHLQETYTPHTATLVRLADKARTVGRSRLRGETGGQK